MVVDVVLVLHHVHDSCGEVLEGGCLCFHCLEWESTDNLPGPSWLERDWEVALAFSA